MVSPGRTRNSVKRDTEDYSDFRSERVKEEEEWEGDDKRKHRSSRSKRNGNVEDSEGVESSGRKRRSTGERNESQKRTAGSSRIGSDDDEFQAKKELRSQLMNKKQEESALEKLSNWYEDGEGGNKHDGVSKSAKKGHGRADEHERKKLASKLSDRESSHSRTKSKSERTDVELEKSQERDAKHEPKDSSREKGHGSSDKMRSQRRKWDEPDAVRNIDDANYVESSNARTGKSFDPKHENSKEKSLAGVAEQSETKDRDSESNPGVSKTLVKDERRVDSEKSKSKSRSEPEEENNRSPLVCEDVSDKERLEEYRSQRNPSVVDVVASGENSIGTDENGNTATRDKTRDTEWSNRTRSPERSGRRYHESEHSEIDHERNSNSRSKETEKAGYWDDRYKGRDDSWSNRHRNREDSRENWKRRQPNITDKDLKDGEAVYDHGRDWELQRHGRGRVDNERPQGRFGGRKDGNRTEAVKTSSNYGNENYDVIEIQTKPFDYVREETVFAPSRSNEAVRQSDTKLPSNDDDFAYAQDNSTGKIDLSGPGRSVEDSKNRIMDDGPGSRDQDSWRGEIGLHSGNGRGEKGTKSNTAAISNSQSSSGGSQLRYASEEEAGSFNKTVPAGNRGNRSGRGRSRPTGRDNQHISIPLPMVGSPFGPHGMAPPGALQPLTPNMSPGPPIPPGVFIQPFSPPVVWPGARGMDMNMLGVPPGMSPVPPGPSGPRFFSNIGAPPNPAMFYNQPGSGRGGSSNMSGVNFNAMIPAGRGQPQEKNTAAWVPPRNNVPHGKAPSRGEQNDYSQNFVDTGMRPQNYIRELELTSVVEDYPKLRELIQKKDEIVTNSSTAPMYYKCDLREEVLSPEFFGTKFDVILVDPPWEEYVHRAPGVTDHMDYWTFEEIMNLKIEAIADTPSFIFLWVGDGLGLEQGRQCLKKWGFRRCEDICWVKTNKTTATPGLRHDSRTLFQRSKEHCLMGIKGTVRRSTDGHIIHANIDTDVIIAEEPPYGSTAKPEGMYRIVEHFCLGRRRLELFGEDHNIRSGWLTVGKDLSSSNFNSEAYIRNFADKDGKIWQGGGGRNPPPEAGHLVLTTPDIESLRPKSPMKNQLQMQMQHSNSITLTTPTSGNRRPGNSPQNYNTPIMNEEASGSNNLGQWSSQMEGFRGQEFGMGSDDKIFDMYTYNAPFMQGNGDYSDYETRRAMNML